MQKLTLNLTEILFDRLRKMKEDDKYGDKPWEEWLKYLTRGVQTVDTIGTLIQKSTQENLAKLWMENFIMNLPEIINYVKYPIDKEWSSIGSLPKLEGKTCLPPNQLINTADGLKPIKDVNVGDLVLTHKGRYRRVLRVVTRQFDGELLRMSTKGGLNEFFATTTTPEHPYLTRQLIHRHDNNKDVREFLDFEWVEAKKINIRKNTNQRYTPYLTLPRINETSNTQCVEHHLNYHGKSLSIKFDSNTDLMKIIGYYLAEGSICGKSKSNGVSSGIEFSLGKNLKEHMYVSELVNSLKDLGWHPRTRLTKYGCRVRVHSVKMASFLEKNFGRGSSNKYVPLWVKLLPPKMLSSLLEAYINGDGNRTTRRIQCENRNGKIYSRTDVKFVSTSLQLAVAMRDIALKIGYNSHVGIGEPKTNKIRNQKFESCQYYIVSISPQNRSSFKSDNTYQYLLPKKISRIHYSGLVYNLEIEEDESYCTILHAIHNCLVVAAGPSIYKHNHIPLLSEHPTDKIALFLCDRMLLPCLKGGVTPDKFPHYYVGSVDGNRELIMKWFDDPIIDKWAPQITGLFCTTMAPNAAKRFKDAGGKTRWFHGMMDSFNLTGSVTSLMNYMTSSTAIAAGGNVGSTNFTLAYYMSCNPIGLVGLDLGYPEETPIEETAYYKQLKATGAPLELLEKQQFVHGFNPLFGTKFYQDIVFMHYGQAFMEMVEVLPPNMKVINCTESGSVYGGRIEGMKLKEFLKKYG